MLASALSAVLQTNGSSLTFPQNSSYSLPKPHPPSPASLPAPSNPPSSLPSNPDTPGPNEEQLVLL